MTQNKAMGKMILIILVISAIAGACTKKAVPVITERKTEPATKASKTIELKPDLARGKAIFTNRCGRCHDLPVPEQFTARRWEGILSYMIPRARLDEEQGLHVSFYLKTNAAKQDAAAAFF